MLGHHGKILLVLLLNFTKIQSIEKLENLTRTNEFCYMNNFESNASVKFRSIPPIHINSVNRTFFNLQLDNGSPFTVAGMTRGWNAVEKWCHSYFESLFKDEQLFSSTFSTPKQPQFCTMDDCTKNVYYGIFLNNPLLAGLLSDDYEYPAFIPDEWWIKGNEWIHWGHPPCGAKRHMDLTCTSRVSVQIAGSKEWRLYPIVTGGESNFWKEVLQPISVRLEPGDALFWFPGWEHETEITEGLSISLSLHYTPPTGSLYQKTFSSLLHKRVSGDCDW